MKITGIEILRADAGWRTLAFLKVRTDSGLTGWSEFSEGRAPGGLGALIQGMGTLLVGDDPRNIGAVNAKLGGSFRLFAGGFAAQAIGAIDNACLDIKAKALGVPVYELFGGAFRKRFPTYWSQCGTLRLQHHALFGRPPLRTLDDFVALGREVRASGFKALKTNVFVPEKDGWRNYRPGTGSGPGHPERTVEPGTLAALRDVLAALRQGAGADFPMMLDLNFNMTPSGIRSVAQAVAPFGLAWLEADLHLPQALAGIRQDSPVPIASLETVYGRRGIKPYLDLDCVDVALVDAQWNGLTEAMKMIHQAEAFDVNVAPHNYHGHLSTLMAAHMAAATPNFQIMEFVVDEAPWTGSFLTQPLRFENGELLLPDGPGWGSDIDEDAVRAHPAPPLPA